MYKTFSDYISVPHKYQDRQAWNELQFNVLNANQSKRGRGYFKGQAYRERSWVRLLAAFSE